MGATPSKSGARDSVPSRKPLKSRSSLNLLKRAQRTPSTSTRASGPPFETVATDGAAKDKAVPQVEGHTPPASCMDSHNSPTDTSLSSFTSEEVEKEDDIFADGCTLATTTRVTTPDNAGVRSGFSTPESEGSRSSTPALSLTPKILLPQPSMLPEDSPTKYGLRTTAQMLPSPDKTLTRLQRGKMTGPDLFAHSARLLKSHHSSTTFGLAASGRNTFSHSSPCLLTSAGEQTVFGTVSPGRGMRPVTGHSFQDLLSSDHANRYNVVRALPMRPSQTNCFRQHDRWHAAAKPRYHILYPVSCAVCDEYGAPSEGHETAGDDFVRCDWCWLMVCGKCQHAFLDGGLASLRSRQCTDAAPAQDETAPVAPVVFVADRGSVDGE